MSLKNSSVQKFAVLWNRVNETLAEQKDFDSGLVPEDVVKLLQELDRYQIELELQNEKLRQSQIELEQSRLRYGDLYDFAPISYITVNYKGRIIEANLAAAKLFGLTRGELLKQLFPSLIFKEDQNLYYQFIKKLQGKEGQCSCEFRMTQKGNNPFYVQVKGFIDSGLDDDKEGLFRMAVIDISEWKRDELRLREDELRYRTVADYTHDWEFWLRPDGSFAYVSPSCERITGYSPDDFYNTPSLISEIVHPDDQALHKAHLLGAKGSDKAEALDFRIIHRDGDIRWIGHICQVVFDSAGNIIGRRGSNRDISVQKKLEEDLLGLKEKYRSIVMDQYDLICRFDTKGKITFVNDAYCDCFKVKYYDILGTNFSPNIYEEDLPLVENHFKTLTPSKPSKTIDIRIFTPNGEMLWQQWNGRAFFDNQGKVKEFQAVGRDITALKKSEERLNDEVETWQLFMDSLPCVALLLKYETREIVAANKAAIELGAKPGLLCHKGWAQRETPCPWCEAPKLWSSGEQQCNKFWGLGIHWDAYWVPVRKDLYLHYAFDTTENERTKIELQMAHDSLERRVESRTAELKKLHQKLVHSEKLSAIGSLSASIAHEFNNPLQGIMTTMKVIEKYASLEEREKKLIGLAVQECDRMKNLIASLQDFNRPSSGILAPVNIHENIDALLMISKKEFKTRNIEVERDYAVSLPLVMAVSDQLKQVFLNLLNNASFACAKGGRLTIRTEQSGGSVVVSFKDTGVGIDPINMPRIFEPFFTTKPELSGTGLGLPVSYGIVKKHGGEISVNSELGVGSTFSVILPIESIGFED